MKFYNGQGHRDPTIDYQNFEALNIAIFWTTPLALLW